MPGARTVLRRIVELGGTASYDDVQQYFADHLTDPIPPTNIGGTLTGIKAVQRRVAPAGAHQRSRFTSSAKSTCWHCASSDRLADRLPRIAAVETAPRRLVPPGSLPAYCAKDE
jgi:hypothetical protein